MQKTREEWLQEVVAKMEKEKGFTLDQWVKMVRDAKLTKHGEILDFFKKKHGIAHGYASALIHAVRDVLEGVESEDDLIEAQYTGEKAALKPIYEKVIKTVTGFGDDVTVTPMKAYVSLRWKKQFAIVQSSTKMRMDIGLQLKGKSPTERLEAGAKWNDMFTHRVKVTSKDEVDAELVAWLREAYENAG